MSWIALLCSLITLAAARLCAYSVLHEMASELNVIVVICGAQYQQTSQHLQPAHDASPAEFANDSKCHWYR